MLTPFDLYNAAVTVYMAPWNAFRAQCVAAYCERNPNWWLADVGTCHLIPAIPGC